MFQQNLVNFSLNYKALKIIQFIEYTLSISWVMRFDDSQNYYSQKVYHPDNGFANCLTNWHL